ncbi:MAG: hypothetical protein K5770_10330 [Lachnospiraceae bacterium]|nr:hypothetical protein [Lachnospiraceae bacterium]
MTITGKRRSLETCTESGWDAYDLMTAGPLSDEDIETLRRLEGSFLYLKNLRKPFFKIESHKYVIKGVKGDNFFRFAAHRDDMSELDRIIRLLEAE